MNNSVQDNLSQLNQPSTTAQHPSDQQSASQASIETPPGSHSKRPIILLVIIVALFGGGLFGYLSLQQPTTQDTTPTRTLPPQPPQESVPDDVVEQTIRLRNVRGGTATGQATRTYIPGEPARMKFSISTSLPDPAAEGAFYQVWLVEDFNNLASWVPLSILWKGKNGYSMENEYKLPSGSLPLTSYYEYSKMVITLETGDSAHVTSEDGEVGPKFLEGSFTQ